MVDGRLHGSYNRKLRNECRQTHTLHQAQEVFSVLLKAQHIVEYRDNIQVIHTTDCSISPIANGNMARCRPTQPYCEQLQNLSLVRVGTW